MGVRAAHRLAAGSRPGLWSLAALVLAGAGVVASTWLIVASDGDPAGVLWPLVVAPIVVCLAPVLVPSRGARIGAMLAQGAWCIVAGFSIGFLLWPALGALVVAVLREEG